MANNGRLGALALVANTDNSVYLTTAASASIRINLVNTGTVDALARIAVSTTTTPTASDWVEYDVLIKAASPAFVRSGIVISNGERVIVRTVSSTLVARVYGYEDA